MQTKVCTKCKEEKNVFDFYVLHKSDGSSKLRSVCKKCHNIESREGHKKHKEKYKITSKKWYENNKEKRREYEKKWREKNRDKINENKRKWAKNNRKKATIFHQRWVEKNRDKEHANSKRWREKNKDKICKAIKEWREKNREYFLNSDKYILHLITDNSSLSKEDVPAELIATYRELLKLKRELRNGKLTNTSGT